MWRLINVTTASTLGTSIMRFTSFLSQLTSCVELVPLESICLMHTAMPWSVRVEWCRDHYLSSTANSRFGTMAKFMYTHSDPRHWLQMVGMAMTPGNVKLDPIIQALTLPAT